MQCLGPLCGSTYWLSTKLLTVLGGGAHIGGVLMTPLKNLPDGTFDLNEVQKHIRGSDIHEPVTMMVAVENTHSYCGGKVGKG